MVTNICTLLLLTAGLMFCLLGCTHDRSQVLVPDDITSPMDTHDPSLMDTHTSVDVEASFEQNLAPILTARCALAGCHVANGPHGLDFRTYESCIAGGVFIPGDAESSNVVEQIDSGAMPLGGPPLAEAQIQVFVDWINQQEPQGNVVPHGHGHDDTHADTGEQDDAGAPDAAHADADAHSDADDDHAAAHGDADDDDHDDDHDDHDD